MVVIFDSIKSVEGSIGPVLFHIRANTNHMPRKLKIQQVTHRKKRVKSCVCIMWNNKHPIKLEIRITRIKRGKKNKYKKIDE